MQLADGVRPPRHLQTHNRHAERLLIVLRLHAAQPHELVVRNAELLAQRAQVLVDQPRVEAVVTGRHRRMRGEHRVLGDFAQRGVGLPAIGEPPHALLLRDNSAIPLAPTPFGLLCALVRQPGSLLTKQALLDQVWGHRFVSESVLKTAISDLRTVLADDPRRPRYIETVARRGYRVGILDADFGLGNFDVMLGLSWGWGFLFALVLIVRSVGSGSLWPGGRCSLPTQPVRAITPSMA